MTEYAFSTRPRNHGSFYCADCGNGFPRKAFASWCSSQATCNYCGKQWDKDECAIYVQAGSAKFVKNPETILNARWFHATRQPDWYNKVVANDVWVHIGTEHASRYVAGKTHECDLHVIRIKPGTYVNSLVLDDFSTSWDYWMREWNQDELDKPYSLGGRIRYRGPNPFIEGVNPYVNRYESAGSVSLYVPALFLEVVETIKLNAKPA